MPNPVSEKQLSYLESLCEKAGIPTPDVDTSLDASKAIDEVRETLGYEKKEYTPKGAVDGLDAASILSYLERIEAKLDSLGGTQPATNPAQDSIPF